MRRLVFLVILAGLLAACGPAATPTAIPPTETLVPVSLPTSTPTPTPTPPDGKPAITYGRSGGIAGVMEEWHIWTNGGIVSNKGHSATVPRERVQTLMAEIEALGLLELKDSYGGGPLSPCRDCFTYQLTIYIGEKSKTITVQEGAKDAPAELWEALQKVRELIPQS